MCVCVFIYIYSLDAFILLLEEKLGYVGKPMLLER